MPRRATPSHRISQLRMEGCISLRPSSQRARLAGASRDRSGTNPARPRLRSTRPRPPSLSTTTDGILAVLAPHRGQNKVGGVGEKQQARSISSLAWTISTGSRAARTRLRRRRRRRRRRRMAAMAARSTDPCRLEWVSWCDRQGLWCRTGFGLAGEQATRLNLSDAFV
ncbi:uncharacterized protein PFL1_05873 [Pseudozyma flocculosa PF-1]|uniref:Uncharacterized protein n=1 Tax=Pseudozyma flocculosa PF-1 TaxID=1277687 RepID=A0A061H7K4_9BASI|nr:uncharacterized protein PFL1_05873 [Pseudozyma flocculosa PF-1]EPQ26551.1 hypothetical protein PFL1_05873 [Pseudozyma flocculosa PF-1]